MTACMNKAPELILTEKARLHLLNQGVSCITLELKPLMSCCIPYSPPPHITNGPPKTTARFAAFDRENITIYLDPALLDIDRLTIDRHGFSIFSWLSVSDWRPMPPSS
jgi:hypothetical protein